MSHTLQKAQYVSFATFRKSGKKVATPVWMASSSASEHQDFFIFSAGDVGKVKRLRNNPEVELAQCDFSGKVSGEWYPAFGELVQDKTSINQALAALRQKYGWQMWIADIGSHLTGKFSKRAYIRVRFKEESN